MEPMATWRSCRDRTRPGTFARATAARTNAWEGQAAYARIYMSAANGEFGELLFKKSKADWERLREGFQDILASYPDAWNSSQFLKTACMAKDKETARQLIAKMDKTFIKDIWHTKLAFECKDFALGTKNATGVSIVQGQG